MTRQATLIFRVVLAFWLFGWFCNMEGFLKNFVDALKFPVDYDAFPDILRHSGLALAVYLAPLAATIAMLRPSRRVAQGVSICLAALAFFACIHLETCNDATFVTSFWAALWLVWVSFNGHRSDPSFALHARTLAHAIVGLMFLGAAIGKLTPGYIGGRAFYGLYFRDNPSFPYPWMRANLEPETVATMATAFSRFAITAELVLALAPLLPTRFVLAGAFATMLGMMLVWTFHLWSVLSCLFGLMVAAYLILRQEETSPPDALSRPANS